MEKQFSALELPNNAENILSFEEPDKYGCKIDFYTESHSSMLISLAHSENKVDQYYLELSNVIYFQGHTRWIGANICTGTMEDYLSLTFNNEDTKDFINHLIKKGEDSLSTKLFFIPTKHGLIRFVANTLALTQEKPRFFGL